MSARTFVRLTSHDPITAVHEALKLGATHVHVNQLASVDEGRFCAAIQLAEANGIVVEGRVPTWVGMYDLNGVLRPEYA